jgi:hypothetical protein
MGAEQDKQATTDNASPGERPAMAWARLIMDFATKAFYPAILVYVLLLLKPSLAEIDVPGLINRLHSASVGGAQLTFNQAEDVAITIAPLNGRIAEFELTISQLRSEIAALQQRSGMPQAIVEPSPEQLQQIQRFEQNARYTVLVFHASSREARERAAKITQSLLDRGYAASSTETDFSELKGNNPPGSVLLTYSDAGAKVLDSVLDLTRENSEGASVSVKDAPSSLRRGDFQVLVF